jgi:dethiobiotin synthetase
MRRYFITGTDTGAGKTFVTAALARRAAELGRRVFAFKPVETGCERLNGSLVGADQEHIAEAAGNWQQGEQRGLYRFVMPAAPLVSAQVEGARIEIDRILAVANGASEVDVLLVEGAGGWRVPLTETEDMGALARALGAPVIVVGRAGLGTINHTLLTVEAVENDGHEIAAVVLSRRPDDDLVFTRSNQEQIARRWKGPIMILDTDASIFDTLL